ncbi:hypothetical protein KEJ25_04190 [Candidatus Bathyarchaeota archaeon]|nr:hypothetical protein [Candidatus Bathyarchaeota archaeon]
MNHDHYEYWAWSAHVFTQLADRSPLMRKLEETGIKNDVIDLLFHTCLAKIGYAPITPEARILNRVLEVTVSRHIHHMVTKKFILGAALSSIALEVVPFILGRPDVFNKFHIGFRENREAGG